MDCVEFEHQLQDVLDRRDTLEAPAVELDAHALECSACRRLLDGMRVLNEALVAAQDTLPEVDLADAILAAHAEAAAMAEPVISGAHASVPPAVVRSAPARTLPRAPGGMGSGRHSGAASYRALAASLAMLVLGVVLLPDASPTARRAGGLEPRQVATGVETGEPEHEAERESLVAHAAAPYAVLARQTAGAVYDTAALVIRPREQPVPSPSPSDGPEAKPRGALRELVLQPLQTNFVDAFGFLWSSEETGDKSAS